MVSHKSQSFCLAARPTQYCHHPDIDPPLPDVLGQSLSLSGGQLEDGAEWRMGQEDRGDRWCVLRGDWGQDELVMTRSWKTICSHIPFTHTNLLDSIWFEKWTNHAWVYKWQNQIDPQNQVSDSWQGTGWNEPTWQVLLNSQQDGLELSPHDETLF